MTARPIAVLDSGVHAEHPHLAGANIEGVGLDDGATPSPDFGDRTGHGTAVAAALHRLRPDAPLLAVRLLDHELRTTSAALARAIVWAADAGAGVINLSLGTGRADAADSLAEAVRHAAAAGAVCVASAHPRGRPLWPADLPAVVSVTTHPSCPLADLFAVPGELPRFLAHGWPRPIEGRRPTDNFFGPSFAAAHVAARVHPLVAEGLDFAGVVERLRGQCRGEWRGP